MHSLTQIFEKTTLNISVKEAEQSDRILPGHALIAQGNAHLLVKRSGANYVCELSDGPPVNRHRPSVDVLFRSAANHVSKNAIGMIFTGMGKNGAQGMLEMKQAGAFIRSGQGQLHGIRHAQGRYSGRWCR